MIIIPLSSLLFFTIIVAFISLISWSSIWNLPQHPSISLQQRILLFPNLSLPFSFFGDHFPHIMITSSSDQIWPFHFSLINFSISHTSFGVPCVHFFLSTPLSPSCSFSSSPISSFLPIRTSRAVSYITRKLTVKHTIGEATSPVAPYIWYQIYLLFFYMWNEFFPMSWKIWRRRRAKGRGEGRWGEKRWVDSGHHGLRDCNFWPSRIEGIRSFGQILNQKTQNSESEPVFWHVHFHKIIQGMRVWNGCWPSKGMTNGFVCDTPSLVNTVRLWGNESEKQ